MTKKPREIPLSFDDGFRGSITGLLALAVIVVVLLELLGLASIGPVWLIIVACAGVSASFLLYLAWTHRVFARAEPGRASRIAQVQYRQKVPLASVLLGFGSAQWWSLSSAGAALMAATGAAVYGAVAGGALLLPFTLLTAGCAWATVVYAFALSYFRMHSAGERCAFDFEGEPVFRDFLSLALMISAAGSHTAATPATRTGLYAVRTHTVIAFVFNAIVVAMTVSLLAGLVTTLAA